MEEIIRTDREFFLYLNNLGSTPFDSFWLMVSEKWVWVPLYVIFLYLLVKNFGWRNVAFFLIFITLGVTISDQLAGLYKIGIQRLRPCHDLELQKIMRSLKCGGQFGFYSSHASNSFFIANYMAMLLRRKYRFFPFLLFLWAAMVSYSRIYIGVHFPLDLLMGAAAGFLLGGFFATLSSIVVQKRISV